MHLSPSLKLRRGTTVALAVFAAAVAVPSVASAHAVLTAPKPRDNRDDHKDTNGGAPCGIMRTATQPMNAAMAPGSMFNVTWNETVTHPGCFVIDFSASGDTAWQMLSTVPHKTTGGNPTAANPRTYSQMVTLPSAPCTACTLRLRQIMLGSEPAAGACPPATIPTNATYYTCANVVLGSGDGGVPADAGGTGTGGMGAGTGGSGAGTGGSGAGTGGRAGGGTGGRSGNTGGTVGSGGATNPGSGGATNPGSGGAVTSSGGAPNPGSGGAINSSGGATNPGSGGATNPGSGGATNPGSGGATGPGGTDDAPPPPCACGVATPRSLATGALLFGVLLGMTLVRGRARRKTNHNQ